jgi:phosphohistidine phosphatase
MELYLVRHGDAMSKYENPERPLTELGKNDAGKVAAYLAKQGVRPIQIRHSGKARAKQTAEIISAALKPEGGIVQVPGLKPNDDVRIVMESLWEESQPIMLVSHLPLLERLSALLLSGDADHSIIEFRKCSVAALVKDESGWRVNWSIFPSLI